jgi:hypothetical protein
VGEALAAAGPVTSRIPDEDLDITELREFIGVGEIDPPEQGFNTVIGLYDEIWSYADTAEDGLEAALADQPGIEAVDAGDREPRTSRRRRCRRSRTGAPGRRRARSSPRAPIASVLLP